MHEVHRSEGSDGRGILSLLRVVESEQDPEVVVQGKRMIMLGSNNYLGLTSHPKVKEAAIAAVRKYGSGCAGSRFLNGTLDIHVQLEEKLATFFRKENALTFSTGYQTNLGIISSIAGKDDVIVIDKLDHASIIDACRLSYAEVKKFRHNDMKSLEFVLQACGDRGKLVVVDGVYSMEGDIAPLPAIVKVCKKYGARIMVDDAHGVGVLGRRDAAPQNTSVSSRTWTLSWGPTASPCVHRRVRGSERGRDPLHQTYIAAAHLLGEPAAGFGRLGHRRARHHRSGAGAPGAALAQHAQDDAGLQTDGLRYGNDGNADHSACSWERWKRRS